MLAISAFLLLIVSLPLTIYLLRTIFYPSGLHPHAFSKIPGFQLPLSMVFGFFIPKKWLPFFMRVKRSHHSKNETPKLSDDEIVERLPWPIVSNFTKLGVVANLLEIPGDENCSHKGFWRLSFGSSQHMLFSQDPEIFKEVLVHQSKKFRKTKALLKNRMFKKANVFNGDGEQWRRHRTLMNPAFTEQSLHQMLESDFHTITEQLIEGWKKRDCIESTIQEMGNMSLRVIAKVGFGFDLDAHEKEYSFNSISNAVNDVMSTSPLRTFLPQSVFHILSKMNFISIVKKMNTASSTWLGFLDFVIRRKTSLKNLDDDEDKRSILYRMIEATRSEANDFDEEDLRTNSHVVLIAGHEV